MLVNWAGMSLLHHLDTKDLHGPTMAIVGQFRRAA